MQRLSVLFVIGCILIGGIPLLASAAVVNPHIEALAAEPVVEPGTSTNYPVQFLNTAVNPSDEAQTARQIRVSLEAGSAPVRIRSGTILLGDLADGQSRETNFQIVIPRDAEPGMYQLPVSVQYEFQNRAEHETIFVPLHIEPVARFELISSASTASIGDSGTTSLTLRNIGAEPARNSRVIVESTDAELSFGGNGGRSDGFVGDWAPGETKTVDFQLQFSENAIRRNYSIGVEVAFFDVDGQHQRDSLSAGVRPLPQQTFRLISLISNAPIGGSGELNLEVENSGPSTTYESTLTVMSPDADISFAGGSPESQSFVGEWMTGEVKRFTYRIDVSEQAVRRNYSIRVKIDFEGQAGNERTPRQLLGSIRPRSEQTFALEIVNTSLSIGATGTIEARLTNTGNASVSETVVVLQTEGTDLQPRVIEYPVGGLSPGESATVRYMVDVPDSATPGLRRLSFRVRYENEKGDRFQSNNLGAQANVTERHASFSISPVENTFEIDSSGPFAMDITNEFDVAVTDVTATLSVVDPLQSDDTTAFVERIGPGESIRITFHLEVSNDAVPGNHPISIDISYRDEAGTLKESGPHRIGVDLQSPPQADVPLLPLAAGGVVVLLGLVWWFYRR